MNLQRAKTRWALFGLVGAALVAATGCAPIRIGTAWPALAPITIQNQPRVMVTYNNWAVALNPANGTAAELLDAAGNIRLDNNNQPRRWEIDGHANNLGVQFFSRPLLRDNDGQLELILPTHNLKLLVVDPNTARADTMATQSVAAPIVADVAEDDSFYFVPFETGGLVALNKQTLLEAWRFNTSGGVWSAPVVVDGVVYFATIDHFVYALNAADGTPVWPQPVNTGGLIGGSPLVADGFVYVGNTLDRFFKINAASGQVVSQIRLRNWVWSQPVLANGVLYVADLSGFVYALNPENLAIIWETQVSPRGIRPSPLVTENYIIVASRDGKVHWLEPNGTKVMERQVEGGPEILSELVYVPTNLEAGINEPLILVATLDMGRLVVAFSEQSGVQRWSYAR